MHQILYVGEDETLAVHLLDGVLHLHDLLCIELSFDHLQNVSVVNPALSHLFTHIQQSLDFVFP